MKINPASLYSWYRNSIRNPQYRWWMILGSLVYLISPIDISPDIIPIVGQIDDFFVISIMVSEVSQLLLDAAKRKKSNNVTTKDNAGGGDTVEVEAVPID